MPVCTRNMARLAVVNATPNNNIPISPAVSPTKVILAPSETGHGTHTRWIDLNATHAIDSWPSLATLSSLSSLTDSYAPTEVSRAYTPDPRSSWTAGSVLHTPTKIKRTYPMPQVDFNPNPTSSNSTTDRMWLRTAEEFANRGMLNGTFTGTASFGRYVPDRGVDDDDMLTGEEQSEEMQAAVNNIFMDQYSKLLGDKQTTHERFGMLADDDDADSDSEMTDSEGVLGQITRRTSTKDSEGTITPRDSLESLARAFPSEFLGPQGKMWDTPPSSRMRKRRPTVILDEASARLDHETRKLQRYPPAHPGLLRSPGGRILGSQLSAIIPEPTEVYDSDSDQSHS